MDIKKLLTSEYEKRSKLIEKKLNNLDKQLEAKETLIRKDAFPKEDKHDFKETLTILNQINDLKTKVDEISFKIDDKHQNRFDEIRGKIENVHRRAAILINNSLRERKEILDNLNFTKRIINTPIVVAKGNDAVKKAINKMSAMKGSEGAVLKIMDAPYSFGETKKSWIKFRNLIDLHVKVIEKIPKERNLYNYLVGIEVNKKELEVLNPKKISNDKFLILGKTFNTKEIVSEGSIIDIMIEELWRHHTKSGYHYSIHKPRFRQLRPELHSTSSIKDLEDIVTSVGVEVKEFAADVEKAKKTFRDWPNWIQAGLKVALERNIWLPFVIQHHYRGTTVESEDKYKYNLRSVHSDYRQFIPKSIDKMKENMVVKYEDAKKMPGICYGITVNTPPSVDKPDEWDNDVKNVLCEGKLPIPKGWLYVEGIANIDEPGSSYYGGNSIAPGVLIKVAYGEVLPIQVTDHIIKLKFKCRTGNKNMKVFGDADKEIIMIENKYSNKLKNLEGEFEFTINHIGDKHLIFLNKVKSRGRKQSVTKEMMNKIFVLTSSDKYSRSEIAKEVGMSLSSVYNYQKQLGLI